MDNRSRAGNGRSQTREAASAPNSPVRTLIRQIPFLSDLSTTEVVDILVNSTQFRRFSAGDTLVTQDAEASIIYYIVEGKVRQRRVRPDQRGLPVTVIDHVTEAGTLVGRYALIYNSGYTSTVTAETDVLVLQFRTSAMERLLYRFPEIRPKLVPQTIMNRLRTMPLFANVGLVTLSYLAEEVTIEEKNEKEILYTHEQPAQQLYLIHRGQVMLSHPRQAKQSLWLGTGSAFGFPGSIGPNSSSRTDRYGHWATATTLTSLYVLPWATIKRAAHRYPHLMDATIQFRPCETLSQVSVFDQFTDEQVCKLAGFCSFQHIPQHHLVMQQGDIGDSMWILLKDGKASLSALDQNSRALPRTPVDGIIYFGEVALRAQRNVRSTVETEPDSQWLRLHWRDFQQFLEDEEDEKDEKDEKLVFKLNIQLPEDENASAQEQAKDYPWLLSGELIVSLSHRHWIVLFQKLRLAGIILLISLVFMGLSLVFQMFFSWILALSMLLFIPALIWGLLDYWHDYFIITNQRIIQQEKVILTSEYQREALLEQIERVDVETSFWGNMLGYGTLRVFTAGTTGSIGFDMVPEPDSLKTIIFRERGLRHQRYRAESRLEIQNALEQRLGITLDLPSRVRTTRAVIEKEGVGKSSLWQRFWHFLISRPQPDTPVNAQIVWRKHWIVLLKHIATPISLLILFVILMIGGLATLNVEWLQDLRNLILSAELLLGVIVLALLGWTAFETADWWNDRYELTNDRIIDIEKTPLFLSENRKEAQLGQIQDVTYQMSTPWEMILNYGNVVVQTAASQGAFTFDHVPDPRGVKEEINRRVVAWRRQDELRKARDQIRDLPDWFELYNRLEASQEQTRPVRDNE
jgi:CRP-like cAMP-binding protein/ABC-type multidrug transport system fused ATPase/permease subunit